MSLRQLCQMASLLVFAGLPLLQGCSEGDPPLAKQVTRPVKLLTLDEMGNRSLTRYPGVVEASERTDLAFRIGGELKELNVQAGQAVTSGERIALLDDRDARNALSNAQSSYDLALATYRRMQISLEKGAISRAAFDEARAAFLSAQAQFDLAKDQLGYTELKAPFDGVIASVPVDNFQVVAPQQTIAVLQQPGNIDVTFDLPEQQIRQLDLERVRAVLEKADSVAWVRFGDDERRFPARYKEHDTRASSGTLSYTVTLTLPTPDDVYVLAGMSAVVSMDLNALTGESDGLWRVPLGTVVTLEDDPEATVVWRYIADDEASGKVEAVPVEVRTASDDGIFIAGDLAAGDRLVGAGAHLMRQGLRVTAWTQEEGL
ncbi:efflux RND transporter periplasmic adaptor subunit [Halomonas sp.]|uniref:efflux RND transporter periplasmic adaptor subunit n=1 Tax=Halomonas sp. TaxID=1486246 RepID=UPI002579DFF0|nr:efflux RND transporter periplasmic adaptor subunit [Halomonas sp.]MCJ8285599.1 efflux RND transporter periplasmic adaptor subunit [Halomonas sp.]NQY70652.1 efflux RND transporter periplasmic adaptor subunit [Halomonas sp.]